MLRELYESHLEMRKFVRYFLREMKMICEFNEEKRKVNQDLLMDLPPEKRHGEYLGYKKVLQANQAGLINPIDLENYEKMHSIYKLLTRLSKKNFVTEKEMKVAHKMYRSFRWIAVRSGTRSQWINL